jgi:hypothetical protein
MGTARRRPCSDANGSLAGGATHEFEVVVTLKDDRGEALGTVETRPMSRTSPPSCSRFAMLPGREIAALARDPHAFRGSSIIGDLRSTSSARPTGTTAARRRV